VADFATQLEQAPGRPEFVKSSRPRRSGGPRRERIRGLVRQRSRFWGNAPGREVRRCDRRLAGRPSRLEGGDILIEFDGAPIQNIYDFTYALRGHKPGDTVV